MKSIDKYAKLIFILSFLFHLISCEPEVDIIEEIENNQNENYYGDWKRDGMETYLRFSQTIAIACTNGKLTNGSFNPSAPSMTFDIEGEILTFPLMFANGKLLVGVPEQGVNTHNAQYYSKTDYNACMNSGNTNGGNNNGNGSNETTGNATFWLQNDLECGNITVELNGVSTTITSYYPTGNPGCNASGSANFELPGGTYNYSANCAGYTWNGTITITNGQCSTMKLTL